jgi:hypothetical protein
LRPGNVSRTMSSSTACNIMLRNCKPRAQFYKLPKSLTGKPQATTDVFLMTGAYLVTWSFT